MISPQAVICPSSPYQFFKSARSSRFNVSVGLVYSSSNLQNFSHDQASIFNWPEIPNSQSLKISRRISTRPIRSAATESSDTMLNNLDEDKIVAINAKYPKSKRTLAERWREIQGANDWQGLLDPMDDILRKEIIRYGEFAQACYDGFDFDPFSKYCGSCKYDYRNLYEGVGMSDYGYEVTKYLYATSNINLPGFFKKPRATRQQLWSSHANWMGFVAVAQDENEIKRLGRRDIVIAWRVTVTYLEWIADLMDILRPAVLNPHHPHPYVKIESGFLNLYTAVENDCRFCKSSARDQVHAELKRLIEKYKGELLSIKVTGHSLGSALAMITAYDIAETGFNNPNPEGSADNPEEPSRMIPVIVFSFSGPRVGNCAFKDRCEELGLKFLRIVNVHDRVPKVPGLLFNEKFHSICKEWIDRHVPWSYSHVGVELALDHTHSPFLKPTNDLSCLHNLEAHLHLLDGYHGRGQRFDLASGRDPALVNKGCDFLKDHHLVPPFWRQDANRGLVKNSKGEWVQPERNHVPHEAHIGHHSHSTEIINNNIIAVNGHGRSCVEL
eukprot:Gb_30676 [translate_table: standard]